MKDLLNPPANKSGRVSANSLSKMRRKNPLQYTFGIRRLSRYSRSAEAFVLLYKGLLDS